jgi:hypothetical protein
MNALLEHVENPTSVKSKLPKDVQDNLNIVFNLSKDMGVDSEYINRFYCCVLYALDYHSEAEKVLQSIKETELVASQLLVVVGYKVNELMSGQFDPRLIAIMSTNLNSWLKSLVSLLCILLSSFTTSIVQTNATTRVNLSTEFTRWPLNKRCSSSSALSSTNCPTHSPSTR